MDEKIADIIKGGMSRCLEDKGIKDFNNATTSQRGYAFTEFYIREIGQYLFNIYEDDIEDGLECDGKADLNIDFAYGVDNKYYIIQAKYKGAKNCVTRDEISGFFNIYKRIYDKEYFYENANPQLHTVLKDLNSKSEVIFIFLTNDKRTKAIEEEFLLLKKDIGSKNNEFQFEFKCIADIRKELKIVSTLDKSVPQEIEIPIETVNDTFIGEKRNSYLDLSSLVGSEKYKSVLCTVKGTTLRNLWNKYPGNLFNWNIRGYLGENMVNKKIKDTLDREPENFYFFNNGLSAICTEIDLRENNGKVSTIRCKDFQIINGAQTTTTIAHYVKSGLESYNEKKINNLKKVRVLLRITKAEELRKESGLNKKIITYNNSQTVIKASDFRSNDTIQLFLEKKLKGYVYKASSPYKKIEYIPKRKK